MTTTLLIAMAIALMGGIVSGLAGFGFGLVTVPLLLMLFPPATVTTVGSSLTIASGWIVLLSTWRTVQVRTLGALIPGATIGVFLGTIVLRTVEPAIIKLIAGIVVILFALSVLRGWRINAVHHPLAAPIAGLASGTLSTSTGMSGPPVVLLFTTRQYDMQQFRGSITAYFYYVNAVGLALLIASGIVGREQLEIAIRLLPAAIIGGFIGRRILHYVSQAQFRKITLIMLLATGTTGIVAALQALLG
ncbi:MAG: sulfite exporter TauE/SafE family protein [Thermomicrobiales bacterium]|nr:sulfite exporter TauE/SafE family protein [Thermomicrobiales bacterium]MCO5222292.1 sulfite exporter TauE/SafE family protein [Thermomicrobiales bacterium]